MQKKGKPFASRAMDCRLAPVRGARSLPEGRNLHVALARRAGARSLRAPASHTSASLARLRLAGAAPPAARASSLDYLGRLLAPRRQGSARLAVASQIPTERKRRSIARGSAGPARGGEPAARARPRAGRLRSLRAARRRARRPSWPRRSHRRRGPR